MNKNVSFSVLESQIIKFTTVSAYSCMEEMEKILEIIKNDPEFPNSILADHSIVDNLFNNAWTIVDRVFLSRKVLIKQNKSDIIKEFISSTSALNMVRNKMDHIYQNIENMEKSKNQLPILGVITCTFAPDGTSSSPRNLILSNSDFIPGKKIRLQAVPPKEELYPLDRPVCHIKLHAFEQTIDLFRVVSLLRQSTNALNVYESEFRTTDTRFATFI
ncbi:MAG: hypothetical protein ABF976_06340 [Acetobacter syzygii]|uniref:hypothetical protein n=1 Tax=Acetobacter syzygii TaxID=146476 RepID=UPI0039EB1C65